MGVNYKSLYFDDIKTGQEITELTLPITFTKIVMGASAGRDWNPQHHDRDFVQQSMGMQDIFLATSFYMGILARFVTDWAGPESFLAALEFTMQRAIFPGDTMKITGQVAGTRVEGSRHLVDLNIQVSKEDGPTTKATATVELPSRG